MAREEVPKKIIDGDPIAAARSKNPQPTSKSMELSADDDSGEQDSFRMDAAPEDLRNGFSLDIFDIPDEGGSRIPVIESGDKLSRHQEQAEADIALSQPQTQSRWNFLKDKRLWIGVPLLLVIIFGGTAGWWLFSKREKPADLAVFVKRPITLPHYQEKLDFLLFSQCESERAFLSLGLEIEFHRPDYYQKYREETVTFRDAIYQFLQSQRPLKVSPKDWEPIIQKDLLTYLNAALPQSQASLIRISRFQKL